MHGEFQDQWNCSISSMFPFVPSDMHRWLVESLLYVSIVSWTDQFCTSSVLRHAPMIYSYHVLWRLICHNEGSWVQYVSDTWTFGSNWLVNMLMFSNIDKPLLSAFISFLSFHRTAVILFLMRVLFSFTLFTEQVLCCFMCKEFSIGKAQSLSVDIICLEFVGFG